MCSAATVSTDWPWLWCPLHYITHAHTHHHPSRGPPSIPLADEGEMPCPCHPSSILLRAPVRTLECKGPSFSPPPYPTPGLSRFEVSGGYGCGVSSCLWPGMQIVEEVFVVVTWLRATRLPSRAAYKPCGPAQVKLLPHSLLLITYICSTICSKKVELASLWSIWVIYGAVWR